MTEPHKTNKVNDPEFWRFRAEEVRSIADEHVGDRGQGHYGPDCAGL